MLTEMTWVMMAALLVSMVLALGLGANDVGNSFGTSVGAKVLTMRMAFVLATVCEISGAVLLGEKVSDTIWKNIIDYKQFHNQEEILMIGNLSAMIGCAIWLVVATRFRLPVSATHSIVGATVGYALVVNGAKGVDWQVFLTILASWLISPIIAGVLSLVSSFLLRRYISTAKKPATTALKWMPLAYALTFMVNVFSILMNGPETKLLVWHKIMITLGIGVVVSLIVWYFFVPQLRKNVSELEKEDRKAVIGLTSAGRKADSEEMGFEDERETEQKVLEYIRKYVNRQDNWDTTSPLMLTSSVSSPGTVSRGQQAYLPDTPTIDRLRDSKDTISLNRRPSMFPILIERPLQFPSEEESPILFDTAQMRSENPEIADHEIEQGLNRSKSIETFNDAFHENEIASDAKLIMHDRPSVAAIFSVLQIMSAMFSSFTHGFNDVSNAIAPVVAAWMIWVTEHNYMRARTPHWILLYGGVCISIGIWIWGDRTIQTIGEDLTSICPSTGFVIEICSAIAVLIASNMGLPVSSTHCKVGSVVCVGRLSGRGAVNWKLTRNILIAWAATFPVTGVISAAVMTILRKAISV